MINEICESLLANSEELTKVMSNHHFAPLQVVRVREGERKIDREREKSQINKRCARLASSLSLSLLLCCCLGALCESDIRHWATSSGRVIYSVLSRRMRMCNAWMNKCQMELGLWLMVRQDSRGRSLARGRRVLLSFHLNCLAFDKLRCVCW